MSLDDQALEDDLFGFELVVNPSAASAFSASSAAPPVASKAAAKKKPKKGLRFYAVTSVGAKAIGLNCKLIVGVFRTT